MGKKHRWATITCLDAFGTVEADLDGITFSGFLHRPVCEVVVGSTVLLTLKRLTDRPDAHVDLVAKVRTVGTKAKGGMPLSAGLQFLAEVVDDQYQKMHGAETRTHVAPDFGASESSSGQVEVGMDMHTDEFPALTSEAAQLPEISGVAGAINQVPLPEVVQSLELARRTARVDIGTGARRPEGTVFIVNGQVTHAQIGHLSGKEAFYRMLERTQGTYRVRFHRTTSKKTISQPTCYLLLDALRIADERGAGQRANTSVGQAPETLNSADVYDDSSADMNAFTSLEGAALEHAVARELERTAEIRPAAPFRGLSRGEPQTTPAPAPVQLAPVADYSEFPDDETTVSESGAENVFSGFFSEQGGNAKSDATMPAPFRTRSKQA